MKALIFIVSIILCFNSSSADPWNTYQWNRSNELNGRIEQDRNPWFEWWYYKIVLPENGRSYFFVYGVVNPWDEHKELKGTRSYVGMGDFSKKLLVEEQFPLSEFSASYKETYVEVGSNKATDRFFSGSIQGENNQISTWDIRITKEWAYNAEGWMMGRMLTDIEWYPAQASARCTGYIISDGERIDFKDAPCYQDRNWGQHFPDWWAWIVSNHFEQSAGTVLAVGGGKPSVRGRRTPISGMSIGLRHQGKDISFRPIDLQLVKTDISFGNWKIVAINSTHRIEIEASSPKENFMDLQFMTPSGEIFHDYETLTGNVSIKLFEREGLFFKPLPALFSKFAGIEFGSTDEYQQKLRSQFIFREEITLYPGLD